MIYKGLLNVSPTAQERTAINRKRLLEESMFPSFFFFLKSFIVAKKTG